jgi:hypothetical protein
MTGGSSSPPQLCRARPENCVLRRFALCFVAACLLLLCVETHAQDAIVAAANADRLRDGSGGGASVLWIHPRANGTFVAGATFLSLAGTRWAYATVGGTRRVGGRTMLNAEANVGGGDDDAGGFRYILLRGGVTRELIARRLYGEAEWLQTDVARQQDGIARIGAAFIPTTRLTLRGSVYESLVGDNDTTLGTLRADYDFGRISAIAGFSGGTTVPVLLQQTGSDATRVREAFGGIAFDAWTIILIAGEDRQRLSVSFRLPLPIGSPSR